MQDTFDVILYNEAEEFSFSEIQDVNFDSRGHLWLSMTNHGLLRINQNEGKKYGYSETGRTRNDVFCFFENNKGQILIGRDGGIDLYDADLDEFNRIAESSFINTPTYGKTVFSIIQIPNGKYLVGAKSGIHILDLEKDTLEQVNITGEFVVDGGSTNKHVYDFVLDEKRNAVWCTSRSGLIKLDLNTLKSKLIPCPLHKEGIWPWELMNQIFLYRDELFINFRRHKLFSYNIESETWDVEIAKRFEAFRKMDNRDSVTLLFNDMTSHDKYLVIPTSTVGVMIFDMEEKKELDLFLKHEMFRDINAFENPNWLQHKYASEAYFGIIDKFGYLWTSEVREIVLKSKTPILKPKEEVELNDLHISQFWIDNRPVDNSYYHAGNSNFKFKKYERDITLKFDLVNPPLENYNLEYSVNGSKFKPGFNKSLATFSDLKGGVNNVILRALVDDELIRIKNITFEIEKKWVEKWSSRLLLTLGLLFLLSGIYFLRISRIREKAKLENDFNKRISEVKMAGFRSQMNPHFMFNSLNSINQFIVKMEPQKASEYLSKFSNLMRQVLTNSSSQLVTLESDINALNLYLDMERLRFGDKFSFTLEIDKNIDPKDCLIPPLLIQPYVENAIWHGLMPLGDGGKLTISVLQVNDQIKISVNDNGVGRVKSLKTNQDKIVKSKSMGMEITKNRLALVESVYDVETQLKITDKYNGEEATGTLVELLMPYLSNRKINKDESNIN